MSPFSNLRSPFTTALVITVVFSVLAFVGAVTLIFLP